MKNKLPIVLIYLTGCYFSYVIGRATLKNSLHRYTVSDRNFNLAMSSFSWLSATAVGVFYLATLPQNDEPANW